MALFSSKQFEANIQPTVILKFSEPVLNTTVRHYFICVGITPENDLIFSCCTSQFNTVKKLIEKNKYPESTLVYIPSSDQENIFTDDTYINCNEYFSYTLTELWRKHLQGDISFHGNLSTYSFEQILIGFKESGQIEEDIKDCLPDIDDL